MKLLEKLNSNNISRNKTVTLTQIRAIRVCYIYSEYLRI